MENKLRQVCPKNTALVWKRVRATQNTTCNTVGLEKEETKMYLSLQLIPAIYCKQKCLLFRRLTAEFIYWLTIFLMTLTKEIGWGVLNSHVDQELPYVSVHKDQHFNFWDEKGVWQKISVRLSKNIWSKEC